MLIIPVLADAFLPSSLFSCRLKGLELSVSSPASTCSTLYQLSGSAALIIIWPHLFGWLGELWFSFCMLREQRVFILKPLPSFILQKVILWQQTSSNAMSSETALSWTEAIFFYKSLPINIKSWQEMAPPFSLSSPDEEHPHKHTHRNNTLKGHCDKVTSWC